MESIDALQSTLMTIYTYSSSWLQLVIWIVLIYMLTAVPGVSQWNCEEYIFIFIMIFIVFIIFMIIFS